MNRIQAGRELVVLFALLALVARAATAGVAETVSPGEADRFALVPGSCPTFSWAADPGARGHELVVYAVQADGAGTLASSPALTVRFPGQASSWTPSAERCLAPGRYAWAVRSRGVEGEAPWSEALLFEVSEVPSEAELKTALDVVRRYLDARGETFAGAATAGDAGGARNVVPRGGRPSGAAADSNGRGIGERIASRGVPGEPALVLGGTPVARLTASDLSRDSATAQVFDFSNPSGTMTLRVDGVDVVTTATDQDTTYLAGNQLQVSGTTFSVLEGAGSTLDADTLDGIDSTGFMPAGTDLWVDTAGDSMSGTLAMAGNTVSTVGQLELDDAATVTKNGARFVWDDGTLGSLALGRAALDSNTSGAANTGLGHSALQTNTSGANNTAVGWNAMRDNTDGSENTAVGKLALAAGASNVHNTALGSGVLSQNDTGDNNTGVGSSALQANTSGFDNTAVGTYANALNTEGRFNSALGSRALSQNTQGFYNTAVGGRALRDNTTGNENTAVGEEALVNSETAHSNVAIGQAAMLSNTSGNDNTALGHRALYSNSTGVGNVALGRGAGFNVTGDLTVSIANDGQAGESGVIRVGTAGNHTAAFLAGVHGVAPGGANVQSVVIDANGQLGSIAGGGGSGLDADLLDGIDSTAFVLDTGDTISGNLAVGGGLDVTGANLTVGAANFTVDPGTGNTVIAGTLDVTGATAFDGQVDLRDVTTIGDSQSDALSVVATFRFEPRSAAPACAAAADVGTVYFDSDDGTFCFCEGSSVFDYRPLDGAGACS